MVGERQKQIVELLCAQKVMTIPKLAEACGVSVITIRRDLDQLLKEGLIKKIYGGAAIVDGYVPPVDKKIYTNRLILRQSEKQMIAELASSMVKEGDTVYVDSGSTAAMLAQQFLKLRSITVVTNSLTVMNILCDTSIQVYGLGGLMSYQDASFSGNVTISVLQNFCFDCAFLGASGISLDMGVTDTSFNNIQLRQTVLTRSQKSVLLADSSKFGKIAPAVVFPIQAVDCIVTDKKPEQEFVNAINGAGVKLLYPRA